jgi:SAM-dependent methyltransferase
VSGFPPVCCPRCRTVLDPSGGDADAARCTACGLAFAAYHGVPLLADGVLERETEARQKEIYDAYATQRHRGWRLGRGPDLSLTYWSHCRRIAALAFPPGSVVLDVGALDGRRLFEIAATFDVLGVGVDLSTRAVRAAREARHPRLRFHAASAEALPLADASLDVAIAMDVLEHVPHPQTVVREVGRCLKPGGRFLAHVPVTDNAGSLDAWMAGNRPREWADRMRAVGHDYTRMPSSGDLRSWFGEAGFVDVRVARFNAWHQNRFDYYKLHRVLNTLFFVWRLPVPVYHHALIHLTKVWYLLDRARLRRGIGGSVYVMGRIRG